MGRILPNASRKWTNCEMHGVRLAVNDGRTIQSFQVIIRPSEAVFRVLSLGHC
jgi:hypothetical protein